MPKWKHAVGNKTTRKIVNSSMEAARRKFPPEFVNRADKIVVFKPLGQEQLRLVLDIELRMVLQRVFDSSGENAFVLRRRTPPKITCWPKAPTSSSAPGPEAGGRETAGPSDIQSHCDRPGAREARCCGSTSIRTRIGSCS